MIYRFLSIFILSSLAYADSNLNIAMQPLKLLASTVSGNTQYKLSPQLSLLVPAQLGLNYVPLWNQHPGWKVLISSGMDLRIHITGASLKGGFYLQPGLELGWRNQINPYEAQIVLFLAQSNIGAFLIDQRYLYRDNFLNTDLRFNIGYDWFFANGISLDIGGGLALTNVFALGSDGGWFCILPSPNAEFSVGLLI